jgi:glycosyltransferase involved in cell wall biosynthesis
VTDTYPDRARVAEIKLMDGTDEKKDDVRVIARVFAPFKYDNDTRCDLHPRWNHKGETVCFDSIFEGHRGVYTVAVPDIVKVAHSDTPVSQNAKVTCVIPSYKRCDTVTRAIDSVLAQTYKNIEVCLVDDNIPGDEYSQKLQESLKKYAGDSRVRYITQEKHINGAVARNVGIKTATGEYIGFLDDDDEWLPEKIERQMKVLQADPSLDAVTALWTLYEGGKEVRKCAPYTAENLQFKVFLRDVAVFTSTVLIKKSAIERFGGFDGELLRHQDLQFLVDSLRVSKFEVLPEYLVKLHADSEINRPNVEKLIKAKKAFFKSVEGEFKKYSKSDRRRIINAHYYEVVFQALKAKNYKLATKYMLKAGLKPQSVKDLMKRYKER